MSDNTTTAAATTTKPAAADGPLPQPSDPVAIVDASAIVALVDANDRTHGAAAAAYRELVDGGYKLFVTNYTVAEVVELLSAGLGPEVARQWLRDHRLPVYHADEQDEHRARAMVISSRGQRGLSLIDAVSHVVMERFGIADAFAVDPHFLNDTN